MKKLLIALCFAPLLTFGQQSIGYVDVQEIFYAMPDRVNAQIELDAFVQSLVDDLQAMEFNYEQKMKEYEKLDETSSAAVRQSLEQRILQLDNQIAAFRKASDESVRSREDELMKPIYDKIMQTVESVAKSKGYVHVFDVATALVFPIENDFTKAVLTQLGL